MCARAQLDRHFFQLKMSAALERKRRLLGLFIGRRRISGGITLSCVVIFLFDSRSFVMSRTRCFFTRIIKGNCWGQGSRFCTPFLCAVVCFPKDQNDKDMKFLSSARQAPSGQGSTKRNSKPVTRLTVIKSIFTRVYIAQLHIAHYHPETKTPWADFRAPILRHEMAPIFSGSCFSTNP